MSLSELLKSYNMEKYEKYITDIDWRPAEDIEIIDIDSTALDDIIHPDPDIQFTKDQFINKIKEIYGYKYKELGRFEYFDLIGKLDNGKYFWYYYSPCKDFYNLDRFSMEILYSKDLDKLLNYNSEHMKHQYPNGYFNDLIIVKPFNKI